MKKQAGMSLIGVILGLAIFSASMIPFAQALGKWSEQRAARYFTEQVEEVVVKVQAYQYHRTSNKLANNAIRMWPRSLDALITDYNSEFWNQCSSLEAQQGRCKRPDYTPFGGKITYKVINGTSAELTIPTSTTGDKKRVWTTALLKIPFAKVKNNGDLLIRIYPPMQSIVYDGFVKRNGTSPLTGNWNLGGTYGITNAGGLSVRDSDGSQMFVGGIMSIETLQNGDTIKKPRCPALLKPAIQALSQGMYEEHKAYALIGNNRILTKESSTYWTVYMKYAAKKDNSEDFEIKTAGDISVTTYCLPKT